MSYVMSMHWPEMTLELYDRARKEIDWENNPADGGLFHVAWMGDDGFHVLDIWESPDHFQRFQEQRLGPVVSTFGLSTQPTVTFAPVHASHNAGMAQAGAAKNVKTRAKGPAKKSKPKAKAKKAAKAAPKKAAKKSARPAKKMKKKKAKR